MPDCGRGFPNQQISDSRLKDSSLALIREILRDDQWHWIEGLLPSKPGDPGVTASNNRQFVEAVLWIARMGSPWGRPARRLRQPELDLAALSTMGAERGCSRGCRDRELAERLVMGVETVMEAAVGERAAERPRRYDRARHCI
jgi:transposase